MDPRLKAMQIKCGVIKRLAAEKEFYEKEAMELRNKLEELKSEGKEVYEVLKQEEILEESLKMVPDCQKKLMGAVEEMNDLIHYERDLLETEEFKKGLQLLQEAKVHLR